VNVRPVECDGYPALPSLTAPKTSRHRVFVVQRLSRRGIGAAARPSFEQEERFCV
jgi:hypothetical protein